MDDRIPNIPSLHFLKAKFPPVVISEWDKVSGAYVQSVEDEKMEPLWPLSPFTPNPSPTPRVRTPATVRSTVAPEIHRAQLMDYGKRAESICVFVCFMGLAAYDRLNGIGIMSVDVEP